MTILAHEAVKVDDVIQIAPPHKWGGCLAVVSEPKPFGCQCYVSIPHNDGRPPGSAYITLDHNEYKILGVKAAFIPVGVTFDSNIGINVQLDYEQPNYRTVPEVTFGSPPKRIIP